MRKGKIYFSLHVPALRKAMYGHSKMVASVRQGENSYRNCAGHSGTSSLQNSEKYVSIV